MKRALLILMIATMCLSLCSCGKSEAASNADNLILEIGEVTLESGDKISAAETAVNRLTESEYSQLEYFTILEDARTTYDELVEEKTFSDNQAAVAEIEAAIEEITVSTDYQEAAIIIARALYDKANDTVKSSVSNYDILQQAEEELSAYRVQNVINLIDQIGQVTLDKEEQIIAALEAYDLLSSSEKELVTNYDKIETVTADLEELKAQQEERERQQALSSLQIETDKVEGITWYKPSTYPYYANSRSYVLPYIGQRDSSTWLRLKFHYTGDSWIFFKKIIVSIDGVNHYKTFDYFEVERDNGSGDVWEWVDIAPTSEDFSMLEDIASSTETIVRFQGDNYHYDLTVPKSDKTAIKQILTAYNSINNS